MVYNQLENADENLIMAYTMTDNHDLNHILKFYLLKINTLFNIPGHDKKWYCLTINASGD